MDIIAFLIGDAPDFRGRKLSDIWEFGDAQIEETHDFIQLLFPLNEPSRSSFHNIYLSDEAAIEIRANQVIQSNLLSSMNWFLKFLDRNRMWCGGYNHNQLRITRVIKSVRLLVSDEAADYFKNEVISMAGSNINQEALRFWRAA